MEDSSSNHKSVPQTITHTSEAHLLGTSQNAPSSSVYAQAARNVIELCVLRTAMHPLITGRYSIHYLPINRRAISACGPLTAGRTLRIRFTIVTGGGASDGGKCKCLIDSPAPDPETQPQFPMRCLDTLQLYIFLPNTIGAVTSMKLKT